VLGSVPAAVQAPAAIDGVTSGEESRDLVDHTAVAVLAHPGRRPPIRLVSFPYLAPDQVVFPAALVKGGLVAGERRGDLS
jgi:hypothetical protein